MLRHNWIFRKWVARCLAVLLTVYTAGPTVMAHTCHGGNITRTTVAQLAFAGEAHSHPHNEEDCQEDKCLPRTCCRPLQAKAPCCGIHQAEGIESIPSVFEADQASHTTLRAHCCEQQVRTYLLGPFHTQQERESRDIQLAPLALECLPANIRSPFLQTARIRPAALPGATPDSRSGPAYLHLICVLRL